MPFKETGSKIFAAGANDYLAKPVDKDDVDRILSQWVA
jgi:ActR/RegA family two-component response regulator